MKRAIVLLLLLSQAVLADTPPPGVIQLKGATDGTKIGNVGDALKVSGSFTPSGTTTVVQPTGTNLHSVVDNFPVSQAVTGTFFQATQPVSISGSVPVTGTFFQATQPVSGSLGRTWTLGFAGDKVDASGSSVSISNASIPVTGTFFQATQPVSISGSVPVTGPLTDTQLRASAVPVSISGTVPVSGTVAVSNFPATQPISAVSLPLPSGASTSALQSTINTTLGSPFQAGGSIGNTAFGISGTLPAYASTPTFNVGTTGGLALDATLSAISAKFGSLGQKLMAGSAPVVIASDQSAIPVTGTFFQATQPVSGTVSANSTLQAGSAIVGKVGIDQTTPGTTNGVQVNAALPAGTNSIGTVVQTALATGSISNNAAITTAASTFTAPANAIGFILEAESGNTDNIRWAVGSTATASVGMLAEPGRDSGYIPLAANISVIAISGTQSASVQWVVR